MKAGVLGWEQGMYLESNGSISHDKASVGKLEPEVH
jgi:hypothetical protein